MTWITIAAISVILWSCVFDAIRDATNHANNKRPHSRLPWPLIDKWHLYKKLAFYPPLILIWLLIPDLWLKLIVVVASWICWQVGENIGGAHWK